MKTATAAKDLKFSIVIAVFNGEKFIQETIDSLKCQTYRNFEVILIDGASTDATMDIVLANESFFEKIISEKDQGMYDALNKGFKYATGTHYCYLNSDDLLRPYSLEIVAQKFQSTAADLVFGDVDYIDAKSNLIYSMKATKLSKKAVAYLRRVPFAQQSSFWTAEIFNEMGGFDAVLKYVADSKFLLSLYLNPNTKLEYISKIIGVFRIHPDSLTVTSLKEIKLEHTQMLCEINSLRNNIFYKIAYELPTKFNNLRGIFNRIVFQMKR